MSAYKELLSLLSARDDYLILIHRNPDGDAIGSAEALRLLLQHLGKRAQILSADPPPRYLSFLPGVPFFSLERGEHIPEEYTLIAVDVASQKQHGWDLSEQSRGVYLKIDHHKTGDDFAKHAFVDPAASAAGEIVYRLGVEAGVTDPAFFRACYVAIATDTGCFRYSNVTKDTFLIASELIERGVDTAYLNAALFESKDKKTALANALCITGASFHFDGRVAIFTVTNDFLAQNGLQKEHLSELSSVLRELEGVELSLVLKEKEEGGAYRISARSKHYFDCTVLMAQFSGGGHARAAGGDLKAPTAKQAEEQLLLQAEALLSRY